MQRAKNVDKDRPPQPAGSWLAGMMIGGAIMGMATGAMMMGVSIAVRDASLKGG